MYLSEVLGRLRGHVAPCDGRYKLALSTEFVLSDMGPFPCGYLFMPRESAEANELVNAVCQRVKFAFSILTVAQDYGDLVGEGNAATVDAVRLAVRGALLGWQPAPEAAICEFGGAALVYAKDGVLVWRDDFFTQYHLRSV